MDFPIKLEAEEFVSDVNEIKQSLVALFQTERGEMMQDKSKGSTSLIHTSMSSIEIDLYLMDVCKQVPGVTYLGAQKNYRNINGNYTVVIDLNIEYNSQRYNLFLSDVNGVEVWQ